MSDWAPISADASFEQAQTWLAEREYSDGLPLVPPTADRLAAILSGIPDPDEVMGLLPPMFGEITPRAIAYNAVIAGCLPAAYSALKAAVVALTEPDFNVLGIATTTGSAAIGLIVHGPAVRALAINDGLNCLGPGNPANASLGRALSLCLRNIGGAREGTGDMATCGQPAKFGLCFGEPESGPFPALSVRKGVPQGASAVTVFAISGTAEVLPTRDDEGGDQGVDGVLEALAIAISAAIATTGAGRQPTPLEQLFILPPELAERFSASGCDLSGFRSKLRAACPGDALSSTPLSDIHPLVAGGAGIKMAYLPLWGGGTRMITRAID